MRMYFAVIQADGEEGQCKVQEAMQAADGKAARGTAKQSRGWHKMQIQEWLPDDLLFYGFF